MLFLCRFSWIYLNTVIRWLKIGRRVSLFNPRKSIWFSVYVLIVYKILIRSIYVNPAGPAGLWTGRRWRRQRKRLKGLLCSLALLIRYQQLAMRRRKVLIGIKSQRRAWPGFLELGGREETDSSPSKFWKYKKTHASLVVLAEKRFLTIMCPNAMKKRQQMIMLVL